MTLISRDPFARTELHRATVNPPGAPTCDWCGRTRKGGRLFRYWTKRDAGGAAVISVQSHVTTSTTVDTQG